MMTTRKSTTQQLLKKQVVEVKLKDCRKRHISIHNPNLEVHHCPYCMANVVATNDFNCTCCGHNVPKVAKNNYARLEKVLNKAVREYGVLAEDWASYPTRKPVTLEIGGVNNSGESSINVFPNFGPYRWAIWAQEI